MREAEQAALQAAGGDFDKMRDGLLQTTSEYYSETEVATLRNKAGWFLGVKGGNNGESHNHNDVGSGILFVDNCPVIIDAGVMTYRKETFSSQRYTLWCMRSDWHNTPTINGVVQSPGREFTAKGSSCSLKDNSFSTDIAVAAQLQTGRGFRHHHRPLPPQGTQSCRRGELPLPGKTRRGRRECGH